MSKRRYTNATIVTMNPDKPYLENASLVTEDGSIQALGVEAGDDAHITETVDLDGMFVMPGFISAHCHFYGQFVRGMTLPEPIENWQQVLSRMWWKVDRKLNPKQVYYSTLLGLIEGLKSGTTTYFDHHVSAACIEGSLDIVARAVKEAGARACLCYEVSDRYGREGAQQGLLENRRFTQKTAADPMLRGMMGMHAGYTLGDETLRACVKTANELDCGCHIHLAEAEADVAHSYETFDMHVAQRMYEAGVLGPKSIAAHGVHLGPKHWQMLNKTQTTVAHNCQSNMNNAVGCSPVVSMLQNGVKVALGGDGYTYDLFKELSVAAIAQRAFFASTALFSTNELLQMAFYNTANLCQNTFGRKIGILKPGAAADFIALRYTPPTPLNEKNFLSHLLCCGPQNVRHVVVEGRVVVENGRCTTLDEEAILRECRTQAQELWEAL